MRTPYWPLFLFPIILGGQSGCPTEETDADSDGYTLEGGDCNDEDASINPGAAEACGDALDNDCDALVDEGCPVAGFTVSNRISELAAFGQDNGRAEPPVFEEYLIYTELLPFGEVIGGELEYVEAESEQRSVVESDGIFAEGRARAGGQDDYGYGQGEAGSLSYFSSSFEVLAPTQVELVGELTLTQGSDGGGLFGQVVLLRDGREPIYSVNGSRPSALPLQFAGVLEPGVYQLEIEATGSVGLSGGGDAYPEARVSYVVELFAN